MGKDILILLAIAIVLILVIVNSPTEIKVGGVCLSCWGK